jgi:hypothetical protein
MKKAITRILLGIALSLTPFVYHAQKAGGSAAETFRDAEVLILFGQEISKVQYLGILSFVGLAGITILSLGIRNLRKPS